MSSSLPPLQLFFVFLGGGLGACLRVLLIRLVEGAGWLSLSGAGVLSVNLFGCFLAGVVATLWSQGPIGLALSGGFLGGFTTYGAFSVILVQLTRQGAFSALGIQLLAHVVGGVLATLAGMAIASSLRG